MPPEPDPTESTPPAHHLWTGIGDAIYSRIAGPIADAKHEHVAGVLEHIEADLAAALRPFAQQIVDNEALPAEVRDLGRMMLAPEHFGQSIILGIALGAILAPVLQATFGPFLQTLTNAQWSGMPVVPLSPELLAAGVIKGTIEPVTAAAMARLSGINGDNFETMTNTAGQSMGFEAALSLKRRNLLDGTTLAEVLQYSNVNPRFYAALANLIHDPPSIGAVLAGRIKHHLDEPTAQRLYEEAGGNPDNYQWERDTSGRPPGVQEMLHLWNRMPEIEPLVTAAIQQSDIALAFQDVVKELRWYVPPVRSIMPMLRAGAIDDNRATLLLSQNGVRPEDIPAYIAEGHHTRASAVKTLTESQVVKAYTLRRIDAPTAEVRIVALGYDAADAQLFIDLADELRVERLADALTSKIRSLYTAWKMTKTNAVSALTEGGITTLEQADLFHIWDLERTANVHHVTPAQIVGAYRRGEITALECKTRLLNGGVQAGDIGIVVADGWPVGKPGAAQTAAAAVIGA